MTASRQCLQRLSSLPWNHRALSNSPVRGGCYPNRYSSKASSPVDFEAIRCEMLARPAQHTWDVMSPTNSHLLNIALSDFIPSSCQPDHWVRGGVVHPVGRAHDLADVQALHAGSDMRRLPEGHHLVYFPPQIRASDMLRDGTDPFQSPGAPFERRMWAGGSVTFRNGLKLDSRPAVCVETIDQVAIKGPPGEEKIFVDALRRYMDEYGFKHHCASRGPIERRTLVFMRRRSPEEVKASMMQAMERRDRIVKAPQTADFSITLTPTPRLLFYFSALSYNAHSIHLSPEYCREIEGYHNLLVHGPLSLTLILSVLKSQLANGDGIYHIDYRNLAPLYVDEPMRICVKKSDRSGPSSKAQKWDVWVENKDGGLSIKGTASTGARSPLQQS